MARDHTVKPKKEAPVYVEREVNLALVNQKLNEALNLLYKIADKIQIEAEDEEED